jgi:hypothetical protein
MDRVSIIVMLVTLNAALSRALREDVRFFPSLKAPWRGVLVALATLLIAPALDTMVQGTAVSQALITAALAALPTLVTLLISAFAVPQSVAQIKAQKAAITAAADK